MSASVNLRHATTVEGLHQMLAEARRRIEQLQAQNPDAERFQWLETLRAGATFWYVPTRSVWCFARRSRREVNEAKTLREAIDAAIAAGR